MLNDWEPWETAPHECVVMVLYRWGTAAHEYNVKLAIYQPDDKCWLDYERYTKLDRKITPIAWQLAPLPAWRCDFMEEH